MDGEPLQIRLRGVGISQKRFAELLGVATNTVSHQLRGKWPVPGYVEFALAVLEEMPPEMRERAARRLEAEREIRRRSRKSGDST